jgi:hypothetical protein
MNRIALTDQDVIDATVLLEMLAPTLDAALGSDFYITTPFPVILAKVRGIFVRSPASSNLRPQKVVARIIEEQTS